MINLEGRELVVTSIIFQPEVLQIGFFERGDQAEDGGLEQILTIAVGEYESLIDEIQQAIAEDIIEDFKLRKRKPPENLPAAASRLSRSTPKDESTG